MTVGRFIVALAGLNVLGGAVAFAADRAALGRWLLAMALLLAVAAVVRRWLVPRSPLEVQIAAWTAVTVGVLVVAVLATVGVIEATPVETVLSYVAAVGSAMVVYGARKLRPGA